MVKKIPLVEKIALKGLEIAPSQVWGALRIVPLLRKQPRKDLRLLKQDYNSDLTIVSVTKNINYLSYVPHGLVLTWNKENKPATTIGGQLLSKQQQFDCGAATVQLLHRMVKREAKNALRMLPLHLAMEGFLALFFNAPEIAWQEYSKKALSKGLSPRIEHSISGRAIAHLENALRLFEIHEHQVGVLLFVSEVLASAFIVPTHNDYRALHSSLLEDFYGETFYYHGLYGAASELKATINEDTVNNLSDLERTLQRMRLDWADFQGFMANDLLNRSIEAERIYTAGSFGLQRFITDLSLTGNNYIGETIIDDRNEIQYLKIYGLSRLQTKRAYLLKQLNFHRWHLESAARSRGDSLEKLVKHIETLGFGYLINNQLRERCQKMRSR